MHAAPVVLREEVVVWRNLWKQQNHYHENWEDDGDEEYDHDGDEEDGVDDGIDIPTLIWREMFCGRNDPWIGEAYGVSHDDYDDDADYDYDYEYD